MTAANFCPSGSANLDGQYLSINQYQTLYSILGTTYGGDGRVSFALPDMRGRVPIHAGQGPGLTNYNQGSWGGAETITGNVAATPAHAHNIPVKTVPVEKSQAGSSTAASVVTTDDQGTAGNLTTQSTGGNQAETQMQPYLTIRYCIALTGTYPPRS